MENDNIGSRVRRIAANTAGFLTAALVTASVYPSTTFSEDARNKPNTPEYFFEAGQLNGKVDLTCTPGTKAFDLEQCENYKTELFNFLIGNNSPPKTKSATPTSPPYSSCNDCHKSN